MSHENYSQSNALPLWKAPTFKGSGCAILNIPASKSITNRELILSALATSPSKIINPLISRDSNLMISALQKFGVEITRDNLSLIVNPPNYFKQDAQINCGLAGTVMRFVPPLAALNMGSIFFDGDIYARKRPMKPLLDALSKLGANIDYSSGGHLPFTIHGSGFIKGGEVVIDSSLSSQFISALALVGAKCDSDLIIIHSGDRLPSIPHIDMTLAALSERGVLSSHINSNTWRIHKGNISGITKTIEPDLSNTAPFLAAAMVTGAEVCIMNWPRKTTQVGADLLPILESMGATHIWEPSTNDSNSGLLRLKGPGLGGIKALDIDLSHAGELAPNIIALASLANGISNISGIGHIRHHETDRITALSAEINNLGGHVQEFNDGVIVTPKKLSGGIWHSYDDHRMATSGAIIGIATEGVEVENIATTAKTIPNFVELWQEMISGIQNV